MKLRDRRQPNSGRSKGRELGCLPAALQWGGGVMRSPSTLQWEMHRVRGRPLAGGQCQAVGDCPMQGLCAVGGGAGYRYVFTVQGGRGLEALTCFIASHPSSSMSSRLVVRPSVW